MRWLFLFLLLLNLFPAVFATNGEDASNQLVGERYQPLRGKTIHLLSEVKSGNGVDRFQQPADEELPERREPGCFLVGPLISQAVADEVAAALGVMTQSAQTHWREVESDVDYWVYLPAQPSTRATSRLIQELSANEIDSFVISEGDLEGALAVGVFSVKENAERQMQRLESMGYESGIHPVQRWIREYWLLSEDTPSPDEWRKITNSISNEELPQKMSRRSCKTVASALRFQ